MTVRTISLSAFEERITRLVPEIRAAYVAGFRKAALRLERYTVEEIDAAEPYPAVDTGELRRSVSTEFIPDGAVVAVNAPHAPMLEYGTRPFAPPLAPLIEWVLRKGLVRPEAPHGPQRKSNRRVFGPAYMAPDDYAAAEQMARNIQRKFMAHGMAPRRYFTKAWARMQRKLRDDIVSELAKIRPAR